MVGQTMEYCKVCQTRFTRAKFSGDYVHQCESKQEVFDTEDKLNFGKTQQDPDGTTFTGPGPGEQQYLASANTLQSTRADIEGARDYNRNVRGKPIPLFRNRARFVYYDSKGESI